MGKKKRMRQKEYKEAIQAELDELEHRERVRVNWPPDKGPFSVEQTSACNVRCGDVILHEGAWCLVVRGTTGDLRTLSKGQHESMTADTLDIVKGEQKLLRRDEWTLRQYGDGFNPSIDEKFLRYILRPLFTTWRSDSWEWKGPTHCVVSGW